MRPANPSTPSLRAWLRDARRQFARSALTALAAMALAACGDRGLTTLIPF